MNHFDKRIASYSMIYPQYPGVLSCLSLTVEYLRMLEGFLFPTILVGSIRLGPVYTVSGAKKHLGNAC